MCGVQFTNGTSLLFSIPVTAATAAAATAAEALQYIAPRAEAGPGNVGSFCCSETARYSPVIRRQDVLAVHPPLKYDAADLQRGNYCRQRQPSYELTMGEHACRMIPLYVANDVPPTHLEYSLGLPIHSDWSTF